MTAVSRDLTQAEGQAIFPLLFSFSLVNFKRNKSTGNSCVVAAACYTGIGIGLGDIQT